MMLPYPDHFYDQSAVIPFRRGKSGLEVMIITTLKRKNWIVPKGIKVLGMDPAESAAKEAWEEAGIRGHVSDEPMASYSFRKWGGICTVDVYALEVTEELDDWPESDFRDRQWRSVEEAAGMVKPKALRRIIADFGEDDK